MTTHPLASRFRDRFLRLAHTAALTLGLTLSLGAAEAARKNFDLPVGDAATTLKAFTQQSGEQIVYPVERVRGVKTNAVKGEFAARDALDQMLAGTGLAAVQDEKTGALAIKRDSAPNVPRVALEENSDRPGKIKIEGGKVALDKFEVTGSRIPLNTGERPAQPVVTYTALDIERTGISSLGQLFQFIPAVTSYSSGLASESVTGSLLGTANGPSAARTSAQLRGGTESSTLLLVNGKRVARTNQKTIAGVGFDLGGIPLSAIERVEVLLDGASAIYGADAINGVINVILKKHYSGTELRLTYDNTFNKDAGVKTVSLTHGFARGQWSGLITLSATENNIQLLADRRHTATFDRTLFGGVSNSAGTFLTEENGSLSIFGGKLPGLATSVAGIPSGTSFTVADYAKAPLPPAGYFKTFDRGAMSYSPEQSGYARLDYEASDRLTLSGYVRMGRRTVSDNGWYRRAIFVRLPADYPGNPFGVPVLLNKVFWDLPKIYSGARTRNDEYALSATGKLPRDWRYEVTVNYNRGLNDSLPQRLPGANNAIGSLTLNTAVLKAEIAAGRRPNLIYDSRTQAPNGPLDLDKLWVFTAPSVPSDLSQTWTYTVQADGSVYDLWAGEVRLSTGAEYREEYIAFPHAIGGAIWSSIPQRKVSAGYAETRIPLVAPRNRVPLVRQLELSLAAREEKYSDVGGVLTPRYMALWKPSDNLTLRGSYGEGFLVPNLYNTSPIQTFTTSVFSSDPTNVDPLRGNENLAGRTFVGIRGGNPNLKPQKSGNWSYGAVLDVPRIKNLSLSFDYFDNRFKDKIGDAGAVIDRITYAPQTVIRGPNLPGDPAGWPGPITGLDQRSVNIAMARVSGYSFGLRWSRNTEWGEFSLNATGERILRDESRLLPNSPPDEYVGKKYRPMRIVTTAGWARGAWEANVIHTYSGRYWVDSFDEDVAPSRYTDAVARWDVGMGYDFGQRRDFGARDEAWWRRALHDTKWRVTIINALNTEPPMDVNGYFSSDIIDPRLRRYVIDFTKRF